MTIESLLTFPLGEKPNIKLSEAQLAVLLRVFCEQNLSDWKIFWKHDVTGTLKWQDGWFVGVKKPTSSQPNWSISFGYVIFIS